jgi:acetylglutamate kinase
MTIGNKEIWVLKIGGNQVEDAAFLTELVTAVKQVQTEHAVIIVHGGGKEIADLHHRLGVGYEVVEGLRATSEESLQLVEMVLNGTVNTRLVRWLVNAGVNALGLSGIDLGLVRVIPLSLNGRSLGRVGTVTAVNSKPLFQLLELDLTPVISPVSLGEDGLDYNVNADHVAAGIARAVGASKLVFVSNVPGVQVAGHTQRVLTISQVEKLIADAHITGGMIPKVRSATEAVAFGVRQAVITDLAGLARGEGTAIIPDL